MTRAATLMLGCAAAAGGLATAFALQPAAVTGVAGWVHVWVVSPLVRLYLLICG